jgi:DNA-binding GntR family transcriptional regulator
MPPATKPLSLRRTIRPTAAPPIRIEHENLDDKIYARLKTMILERRLLPGERFLLSQLSRQMGVSRTPLVNALKRLAQEQLVEWVSRRGIYVRRFTKREMADLYEVRVALEGLAVRLAATRIHGLEVGQLEALFRDVDLQPTPAALRRYVELDREFHWRLVELSGNRQLLNALKAINMLIFAYQYGLLARTISESLREHRRILKALRARDGETCERLMRAHHGRSAEKLRREAEEQGRAGEPAGASHSLD